MNASRNIWSLTLGILFLLIVVVGGGLGSCAAYNSMRVWNAETAGEAELAQARQNRQIATLEAEAKLESAKLLAQAEVERAKGVAEANRIVANGLGGPEGYLRYLYIENLSQSQGKIIYVPTEAGLPILEAGKRGDDGQ
ncbi:membrane protease subunit [Porphyrobacter sp. ULC335]|jgi:regulator of protease activity HflC (stomatin/prohibitin superfamily)|uniref:membrane protease subunit n=1 Tax=Porphyrobacter sp. ULC335 TaxID=2854260 RepID=UPI00221E4B22|nr:membrane protease subunit [Porphyrobacter sp. ULC335]UYV16384.1 membrane protease subunit [Porphyrobacter sp. ULC335]